LNGKEIKTGIFNEKEIVPYGALSQVGKVQETPLNLAEIAIEAETNKDVVKICLQRVFREMLILFKKVKNPYWLK